VTFVLAVIETHPVQYHAPVYRALEQQLGVPVTAIYGSDFSVAGYRDREFGKSFAWDTDLLSGYSSQFLSRVADSGARTFDEVSTHGLRDRLRRLSPSAVMILGYSPRFNREAWHEARRTGQPILFRGETSDEAHTRGWLKSGLRRGALGLAYRSCDRLLYIGVRSREHFERLGLPADRLVFSPYCVETTPFEMDESARAQLRPQTRHALGIADDRLVVLYSGKLSERKGVDVLIGALRALPTSLRAKATLLVVGNGDQRATLEAMAAESPAVSTTFAGFQNQTALSRFYHAADLFVLPSRHSETWGLVVNEAQHHGLPCVVSDRVGCAPDLIKSGVTGVVCESGSTAALAAAIESALPLVGRSSVRANCRDVVSQYTVSEAAKGIALAFRSVLASRSVAEKVS
jgi:glycosyltransferase involved in cell wall biosynthesis